MKNIIEVLYTQIYIRPMSFFKSTKNNLFFFYINITKTFSILLFTLLFLFLPDILHLENIKCIFISLAYFQLFKEAKHLSI